jgi:hypothetical protein
VDQLSRRAAVVLAGATAHGLGRGALHQEAPELMTHRWRRNGRILDALTPSHWQDGR